MDIARLGGKAPQLSRRAFMIGAGISVLAFTAGYSSSSSASKPPVPSGVEQSPMVVIPDHSDPQLSVLNHYENEANVAPQMMDFIGFPETPANATSLAEQLAGTLQAWHQEGVRPLIIMEPTFNEGQSMMSLSSFNKGEYDTALNTFFSTLKRLGINDQEMGTWVPFPEPNDPIWTSTSPTLFSQNVTKVAHVIKANFPKTPVSIMLDSQTSLKTDYSDSTTNPNALTQYLHFEPGLISSFGLQGFTWNNTDSPSTYLSAKAAILGASKLGVKNVWFNTGTYSVANNPNGEGIISASNTRRQQVLAAALSQAVSVQKAGFTVDFINVFGQDTFNSQSNGSGTADFEYTSPNAVAILKGFVTNANSRHIPVTIFDSSSN
jgi:hypothetical protein